MTIAEKYMSRCIELAQNGFGTTYPNPMVGAVIVHENKIIGEGWHQKSGTPHAEVHAINSVRDKSLLKSATLYVSLEPCSHFGKTPPCCDLIIKNEIPNIVVGAIDQNPKVAGSGIQKLIDNGRKVEVGILKNECNALNKRFFTFHEKKRPYIILKWAESQDGFISPSEKQAQKPVWITNNYSRQLVHQWRSQEQAILVGTQTVIDDNPFLTVRDWSGNNPIRIVLDQNNRIPKQSHIFDNQSKTIVYSAADIDFNKDIGIQIAGKLFEENIQSLIVEGGRKTLQTFIDENLWDEARIFKGALSMESGTKAPVIHSRSAVRTFILDDELLILTNHD